MSEPPSGPEDDGLRGVLVVSRQRSAFDRAEARTMRRFVAYLRHRTPETEAFWREAARLRDRLERRW